MDYRDIVKRLMEMWAREEGTYLKSAWDGYFSPDEMAELENITNEIS